MEVLIGMMVALLVLLAEGRFWELMVLAMIQLPPSHLLLPLPVLLLFPDV